MYNRYMLVLGVFVAVFANCSQSKIVISPLKMACYTDTIFDRGNLITAKIDAYIVHGYTDTKKTQQIIDSFVEKNKDKYLSVYGQYEIIFYKESSKTNVKYLAENPRDLYRYSQENDWIYSYHWSSGTFTSRWKIKNGEMIEPKSTIKLETIPDSLEKHK